LSGAADEAAKGPQIRQSILGKPALKAWYEGVYARWAQALEAIPAGGVVAEIGSGAAFAKERVPGLLATDTLPYPGVDLVVDGSRLPWADGEVRALFLLNVFHHLGDPAAFLAEAQRVLKPGGLLFLSDQHPGFFAWPILRWGHSEPFDPFSRDWKAPISGPLSGSNGAAAWMVFQRDLPRFRAEFPGLDFRSYRPFAPLLYWISGGLKAWSLAPRPLLPLWLGLDRLLLLLWRGFGSFTHIDVRRV
jgi:SAM-dependent methyltransferase